MSPVHRPDQHPDVTHSPEAISDHSGLLLEIDPSSWAPESLLTPLTSQS